MSLEKKVLRKKIKNIKQRREDMEKLYNEKGQVAVAVSCGYGAGWSTWNSNKELCLDKNFNELILKNKLEEAEALAKAYGYYEGGLEDCGIAWLEVGTKFFIVENDGYEELITEDSFIMA